MGTNKEGEIQKWAEHIRRRGQVFLEVIQVWVRHIRKVIHSDRTISWHDVPGYREVLSALLEEMQSRHLDFYPEALVKAVKSFLANPRLLNSVIKIVFGKTFKFNSVAVLKTMDMT